MIRRSSAALVALVLMLVGAVGLAGVPSARAQQAPDKSDVVIVLDFSASILQDKANRHRFATALDADRRPRRRDLGRTSSPATRRCRSSSSRPGPPTIPGCTDLKTLGSPRRRRASSRTACAAWPGAYRKGLDPNLAKRIGVDTNYVAAMESGRQAPAGRLRAPRA